MYTLFIAFVKLLRILTHAAFALKFCPHATPL